MIAKYISGAESLDSVENFRETMIGMGVEHCIQVIQNALDRYNAR